MIDVAPKGPAQRAGVRAGDVIVAFDGKPVTGSDRLRVLILSHRPGDSASVAVVRRDGSHHVSTVTLAVRPLPTASP